jgi:hypothetical protein
MQKILDSKILHSPVQIFIQFKDGNGQVE